MDVSAAGSSPRTYVPSTAHKPAAAPATAVQPAAAAPVGADGDHDGDSAAGDRLDVRG